MQCDERNQSIVKATYGYFKIMAHMQQLKMYDTVPSTHVT